MKKKKTAFRYCVEAGDSIPPSLPLQKGVPRFAGFEKEGAGEISKE